MNYYPHHIGDYARDTAHLSMVEEGAYRRLLDLCYATEKPLPLDREKLYRLARATTEEEKQAISIVLGEFFIDGDGGWYHKRVREEIKKASAKTKAARDNGKKGGRPVTRPVSIGQPSGFQSAKPNETHSKAPNSQTPIANSQEPKKREEAQRSRGSRLPADWQPSEILKAWAEKERTDLDITATIAAFKDYYAAAPGTRGVKLDWEATFRTWVRKEAAPKGRASISQPPQLCSYCPRPWQGSTNGFRYCGLKEHYDNARDGMKPTAERKSA